MRSLPEDEKHGGGDCANFVSQCLIKGGQRVEKVKLNDKLSKQDYKFVIMSYEKDTYYSLGEVQLNVKVGK